MEKTTSKIMEGVKLKIKGKGNMPAFYLFYTLSFSYFEF